MARIKPQEKRFRVSKQARQGKEASLPPKLKRWRSLAAKAKHDPAFARQYLPLVGRFVSKKTGKPVPLLTATDFRMAGAPTFLEGLAGKKKAQQLGLAIYFELMGVTDAEIIEALRQEMLSKRQIDWTSHFERLDQASHKPLARKIGSAVSKLSGKPLALLTSREFGAAGAASLLKMMARQKNPYVSSTGFNKLGIAEFKRLMAFSDRELIDSAKQWFRKGRTVSWQQVMSEVKDKKFLARSILEFIAKETGSRKPLYFLTLTEFSKANANAILAPNEAERKKGVNQKEKLDRLIQQAFSQREIAENFLEVVKRLRLGEQKRGLPEENLSWRMILGRVTGQDERRYLFQKLGDFICLKTGKRLEQLNSHDFHAVLGGFLRQLSPKANVADGLNIFYRTLEIEKASPGQEPLVKSLPEDQQPPRQPSGKTRTPKRIKPARAARLDLRNTRLLLNKEIKKTQFKQWKGLLARELERLPAEKRIGFLEKCQAEVHALEQQAFESLNQRALKGEGLTAGWNRDANEFIQAQAKGIVLRKAVWAGGKIPSQAELAEHFARVFPKKKA